MINILTKILNEKFYNLNAINLNDYENYEAMRTLAYDQFGILLENVYMPS